MIPRPFSECFINAIEVIKIPIDIHQAFILDFVVAMSALGTPLKLSVLLFCVSLRISYWVC
ncbi:MAG: hypothetical protein IIV14_00830 [Bacteroidaceae bacterium]|nr:hypothetical protein [Bacteroidaceae bacterium]